MGPRILLLLVIVSVGCEQEKATDEIEVFSPQLKRPISSLMENVPKTLTPIENPAPSDSSVLKLTDPIRTATYILSNGGTGAFGSIEEARTRLLEVEPPDREIGLLKACVELVEMTRNRSTAVGDKNRDKETQRLIRRLDEIRTALGLKDDDSADEPLMLATQMMLQSVLKLDQDKHARRIVMSKQLMKQMAQTDDRVQRINRLIEKVDQVAGMKNKYSSSLLSDVIAMQKELRLDRSRFYQLWREYGSKYPLAATKRPPGQYGKPSLPDHFKHLR